MPGKEKRLTRRRRLSTDTQEPQHAGMLFIAILVILAFVCLAIGLARGGWVGSTVLAACISLLTGVCFVAIGILELEWLERIVGFIDGIVSGITQFLWTSTFGTISDSELVGRRGATVFWVMIGMPIYLWGCLLALRVFEW